jgi:hypothetical protein
VAYPLRLGVMAPLVSFPRVAPRTLGKPVSLALPRRLAHGLVVDVRAVQRFSRHKDLRTLQRYDDHRQDLGGDVAKKVAGVA